MRDLSLNYKQGVTDFVGICDRRTGAPSNLVMLRQIAVVAVICVRSTAEKRPGMVEVVECLKLVRKRFHSSPIWCNLRSLGLLHVYTRSYGCEVFMQDA